MYKRQAFAEEPAEAPDNEAPTVSENADETEAVENDENLAGDTTDKEQIACLLYTSRCV